MQTKTNDRQTERQPQADYTGTEPLPNGRHERFAQLIAAGMKAPTAYQRSFQGRRTRKTATEAASRLYKRDDVRSRYAYLVAQRPENAGQEQESDKVEQGQSKEKARKARSELTKTAQPVDGQPLNRELVRKMLLAALSSESPNSATVSAIRAAQDFIAKEQPADSQPGPETIADYLANGAPANTSEIPRIVSALCKAYQITRQRFADLAHLSMDAQTCDTTTIMRHSDEIQPKSAGDLSSNNNDIGL